MANGGPSASATLMLKNNKPMGQKTVFISMNNRFLAWVMSELFRRLESAKKIVRAIQYKSAQ